MFTAGDYQQPYDVRQQPYDARQQAYDVRQQPYVQEAYVDPTYQQGQIAQAYSGPMAQEVTVVGTAVRNQQPLPHEVVMVPHELHVVAGEQHPPTHCFLSWFACLCCCCPIGLLAIYLSMSVSSRLQKHDFEGAYRASESAKKAALAAIIIGFIGQILTLAYESQNPNEDEGGRGNRGG